MSKFERSINLILGFNFIWMLILAAIMTIAEATFHKKNQFTYGYIFENNTHEGESVSVVAAKAFFSFYLLLN